MNEEEKKYELFLEVWSEFEKIKDILLKAGIPENRLLPKEKLEKKLFEWHMNKLRDAKLFIHHFKELYIAQWLKIRSENTEDYWSRAVLFRWGDEYVEVKLLNGASKQIRENWFDRRNILVRQKKEKKDAV